MIKFRFSQKKTHPFSLFFRGNSIFSLFFRGNSIFWKGALKNYGYVLICSSKCKSSNLKRQKIWLLSKTFNQIPTNYEGWTCKGSPTVSPEVANSHQKMAHESPAFLRNQRQSRTAEITAGLTGQLPRPPQSYFYNKGIFKKTSSSNKIALLTLHKQLTQQRKRKKCLLFIFVRSELAK